MELLEVNRISLRAFSKLSRQHLLLKQSASPMEKSFARIIN